MPPRNNDLRRAIIQALAAAPATALERLKAERPEDAATIDRIAAAVGVKPAPRTSSNNEDDA
jgi:AcrR family transcriptional regulator